MVEATSEALLLVVVACALPTVVKLLELSTALNSFAEEFSLLADVAAKLEVLVLSDSTALDEATLDSASLDEAALVWSAAELASVILIVLVSWIASVASDFSLSLLPSTVSA